MSFHDGAVDQIEAVVRFRGQLVEDFLPNAAPGPAIEAIIGRRVRPVAFRQIPPGHAGSQHIKDRVHDLAVVGPRALAALRHQRLKQRPLLIGQIKSHDPPPIAVNHCSLRFSMLYVSTDPSNDGAFFVFQRLCDEFATFFIFVGNLAFQDVVLGL